ncbi:hypothetical protein BFW01_g8524 [Lasiodiplodia theobromae]|nr:hypothetical protein BFW01_g8524 [Lasiodiplodia theobromae]
MNRNFWKLPQELKDIIFESMFEHPDDCWPKDIMTFPWKDVNVEFTRWRLPQSLLPVRRPHVKVYDDYIKITGVSYCQSAIWDQRVLEELMAQPEITIEIETKVNYLQQVQQPLHELHTVPPCLPAQVLSLVDILRKYDQSKRQIVVWLKIMMYSPPWYPPNVSKPLQIALDGRGNQVSPAWENFSTSDTEKLARCLMRPFMILENVEGIFRMDVKTRSGTIKFNGSAVWVLWKQNWGKFLRTYWQQMLLLLVFYKTFLGIHAAAIRSMEYADKSTETSNLKERRSKVTFSFSFTPKGVYADMTFLFS